MTFHPNTKAKFETKTMEKAILEWFNELPEPIRSQAIANYDGEKNETANSQSAAILIGLVWHKTPKGQGYSYWSDIYDQAKKGEFDKQIESDIVKAARTVVEQRAVAEVCSDNLHYAIDELEKLLK